MVSSKSHFFAESELRCGGFVAGVVSAHRWAQGPVHVLSLGQSCSSRSSDRWQKRPECSPFHWQNRAGSRDEEICCQLSVHSVGFWPLLVVSRFDVVLSLHQLRTGSHSLQVCGVFVGFFFPLRKSNTLVKHVNSCHVSAVC